MKHQTFFILLVSLFFFSCGSTKKISYFQDLQPGLAEQMINPSEIRILPKDKISIIVSSKDPQLANLFNLPIFSQRAGVTPDASINTSLQTAAYVVDNDGNIAFPILGKIHVAGFTREELIIHLEEKLKSQNLINDPIITIDFLNTYFSVLGEVNKPGRFFIDHDRMTVLDAISLAGDLTIFGKRETVYVIRQENDKQVPYLIDLNSAKSVYNSPAYYLQQNDVIYIEPNTMKARQSTVNGNNIYSASFWMSLASLLTTIAVLIVK